MPFDWEKFKFNPESEVERMLLKLFEKKHLEHFKYLETRIPIKHERAVTFFYGWITGFKDGKFIDEETKLDFETAFAIDYCKRCGDKCDDFSCEELKRVLEVGLND